MQTADLPDTVYKRWLRRPPLYLACAWFWMAAAGKVIVPAVFRALFGLLGSRWAVFSDAAAGICSGIVYQTAVLALPVLLFMRRHSGVELAMRLTKPEPVPLLAAIIAGGAAVPLCSRLSLLWAMLIRQVGGRLQPGLAVTGGAMFAAYVVLYAVVPGVCEELLFRGGILGTWERRGRDRALMMSALLFALLHGSVQGLPVQILMGFVLGEVVLMSGSLYVSMGFHIAFNALTMLLALGGGGAEAEMTSLVEMNSAAVIFSTLGYAALFAASFASFWMICRAFKGTEPEKAVGAAPVDWLETVILMAGLLTVTMIYLADLLKVCGVL